MTQERLEETRVCGECSYAFNYVVNINPEEALYLVRCTNPESDHYGHLLDQDHPASCCVFIK